jgi:hypothetical protein
MICPLCGTEFDETDHDCLAACPIASVQGCNLVCCPHCGYQMVDENRSALARGLRKLISRKPRGGDAALGGPGDGDAAHGEPGDGDAAHGEPGGGDAAHGEPGDGDAAHGEPGGGDAAHGEPGGEPGAPGAPPRRAGGAPPQEPRP